ncbi:hypothetical protein [Rhizobium lusitanum]|uniref:hypothetical protein n=1 Tax=Rhizobium lusitanum TaxID=293958 RepID=UPI00195DA67F|nr:hypothetical protein [Rhizobium lusitanum]MBM7047583.1 hypothetical protein [Rhizobium lusitanum]
MANAFDQFDGAAPAIGGVPSTANAGTPTATTNPFDQFDDAPTAFGGKGASAGSDDTSTSSSPTVGDVAKSAGWGLVTGIPHAIASTADLMEKGTADALTFSDPNTGENQFHQLARNLGIIGGEEPDTSNAYEPTTGTDLRNVGSAVLDKTGINIPEPKNAPERIARTAGEFGVTMLAPELMAGKLGSAAKALGVGTVSGAASQSAAEAVPEKYKPIASLLGGIGGGMAGEAVASIPKVVGSGARAAVDYASPLTEGGQQRMAGTALREAASNPDEAIGAIDTAPRNIVPGSNPTTFQLTGDPGLGTMERAVAAKNPEQFQGLRGEQNAARLDALSNIQSEGHPEAVSGFFRDQLQQIDNETQLTHDFAQNWARNELDATGGGHSPEAYGEDIKGLVNPQIEAATNTARTAAEGLGGGRPEVLGEQARTAIQTQLDAMKARERQLWSAVDPDGKLITVTSPLKQAAQRIYGDMGPEASIGMAPVESELSRVISSYGQTLPFQRLVNLRSAISQAMRDANSPLSPNQPAYGRLTQLRGAVEDAISDSVAQKAAQEQQAVFTGAMRPEDTLTRRLQRESQEFMRAKRSGTGSLGTDQQESGTAFSSGSDVSSGKVREGSGEGRKTSGTSQDSGTEGSFLDEEAAQRLKTATAATAERKQTFGAKPVSQILQRPGSTQPYTLPSAGVTSSIWKPGNAGADTVRSALSAAKNNPEAVEAVRNMAATSLREKAPQGIITSKIFNQWRSQHAPALQSLEQAAPGTIARFENASRAAEGLQRFENFNPETASGVLPDRYFSTGEKGFAAVQDLRDLVGKDKADKLLSGYAADSLRKSAARSDGTLDPGKFEAWQKTHSGALRAIPDLQAKFMTASKAADNLASVAAQRKDVLDAYQKGAVGKLLKVDDPADVVRTVGSIFGRNDSVQQMRQLAQEAQKNPDALAGLRKSIVEHMESKLVSNTEAATSGRNLIKSDAFQSFLGKNFTTLRQVFNDDELNMMRAVAQDLKRANRSISSSKLPGGSNTAQDLAAINAHDMKSSLLGKFVTHAVGSGAGFLSGGPLGTVAGFIGGHVLGSMREAGIRNVNDLIRDAMLNPDLAKALMMKAPKRIDTGSELTLASKLKRLAMFSSAMSQQQQNH